MMVGFAIIGLYILHGGNNLTNQATDSFYNYNLSDKKEQSKIEVMNRLDEINFERSILISEEKKKLSAKIKVFLAGPTGVRTCCASKQIGW